ncbi:hypothetical protein ACH5RR_016230 [Cinchona calisaya]|uniref:RIN4 pathogenic type III effector avirulence factor Avr cleavage site domain-containing protein n=1 Tax=Cinchona calisaya TaxID=153742 RepID=A0ABD2ZVA5_9GENT
MNFEVQGKRSGQIPAFGDWDNANELPITQYFESARQAGLIRGNGNGNGNGNGGGFPVDLYAVDFHKPSLRVVAVPPCRKIHSTGVGNGQKNLRKCGCHHPPPAPPHVKDQQKRLIKQQQQQKIPVQVKVYDVVDVKKQPRPRTRSQQLYCNNTTTSTNNNQKHFRKHSGAERPNNTTAPPANVNKPVDEDLYKIPPELLLHNSKKKKMLGFFSKCLAPPCNA